MVFNIEGHASLLRSDHIEQIAAVIRKYNPDVVGINEAHRHTWQSRFEDHTEQLRLLTGMNVAFGRSYRFLGGDFGNAVLTRGDRFIIRAYSPPVTIGGGLVLDAAPTRPGIRTAEGEAARQEVNRWIRTGGKFDAVVDFDAVTRDPQHPERLRPELDSGDNIHPNDAGNAAMADAIDIAAFDR